jgi:hypothetical protein
MRDGDPPKTCVHSALACAQESRRPFFALDPLVFADLLFNEVGDPVEGVGLHHRRNRDVLLDF